jgi:predicted lipoprotein with Yx(FWY)xxD motif
MRFSTRLFSTLSVLLFLLSLRISAQWSTNPAVNNAISTATSAQNNPIIVSDGSGGAIITWTDWRNGGSTDIYAQHINASGTVQWTTDGVVICTAAYDQTKPTIVSDGLGGAIITWTDYRSGGGSTDIYAQRINASGTVQWTADGVVISTAVNEQYDPTITSDGTGGAIITWTDYRNGLSDIYAQRINASGTVQWTADGVAICTTTGDQYAPTIVSDGSGGAIITWYDTRSGNYDIYVQRINASGTVQWTTNGVAICTASNTQTEPTIVGDGAGGAIITWYDYRSGTNYDIYAQRISASGTVQWTANGVAICNLTSTQTTPTIDNDGAGGAIITWSDYRSGTSYDIYTQRINASGVVQWTANGVAICTATGIQTTPKIVSDGSGGAIITWYDYRNGNYDIYAQRINASGVIQWVADGVAISRAASDQENPTIVGDGTGGAIITWKDSRSGTSDIYAQRIDRFGNFNPAPWIDKVGDVANDQGGKLRIFWTPSSLDIWGNTSVKSYTIKLGAKTTGLFGKVSSSNSTGIYWQTAGTILADWSEGYTTAVATLADSGLNTDVLFSGDCKEC